MNLQGLTRRNFLKQSSLMATTLALAGGTSSKALAAPRSFDISLAGWSLHKMVGRRKSQRDNLDMPQITSEEFGIQAIELVNQMMSSDKADYIQKLGANAVKHDVEVLLIMIDEEGNAGDDDPEKRAKAVTRHNHWIDIAADLGCHSVRMNWGGAPKDFLTNEEACKAFIERSVSSFQAIAEHGANKGLNVCIENHWGPSSYSDLLIDLIKRVDTPTFGTLPDFGNFPDDVDRYNAIDRMMPYAKAVSAKCYDFDAKTGLETTLDYERLLANVADKHGYTGHIGIEYEGENMSEFEGIKACKKLLETLRG